MIVLGIESTCDETAAAIVKDGNEILSNVIFSQIDLHKEFGGVFPELACRTHLDIILPIIDRACKQASITLTDIDLISVAKGPGLMGALIIGVNVAQALGFALNKPVIGINHIEAHLYSSMMKKDLSYKLPAIGVVISGGHTDLVLIEQIGKYTSISSTVDDAIGESFDKVAKMLSLPYPGGPEIEKLALKGDPNKYPFKPSKVKNSPLAFSFSGLKTQVLRKIEQLKNCLEDVEKEKKHIAASFQLAALSDIVYKTIKSANHYGCRDVFLGGGVSNSSKLRDLFAAHTPSTFTVHFPSKGLSLDNAAMIAGLAYHQYQLNPTKEIQMIQPQPRIPFAKSL